MDAPEADFDVKLQKASGDLIDEFDRFLPAFVRRPDDGAGGGSRVRSRVRAREVHWATNSILDPFQELPQLLDPHLPKWIPLLSAAYLEHRLSRRRRQQPRRPGGTTSSKHLVSIEYAICKLLYTFCKIRGEKVIVHFLNVEAKYLELLLGAIEEAEEDLAVADGTEPLAVWSWEQRYIVLLWLSHLMLAPFDLSTISSVDLDQAPAVSVPSLKLPDSLPGITQRAIPLAIKYLASPGKERDGAKALLVRVAMRRDMQQAGVLDSLIQWSLAALRPRDGAAPGAAYHYLGVLSFLAGILQSSSDTSDLNRFLPSIFTTVHAVALAEDDVSKSIVSFALARKMILKVIRSVVISLLRDRDDMESMDMTETAIGYLLESLSDNDTPVRFAASKSLSIITLKLDPDMASQVVEAVLESLNRNVLWKKTEGPRPVRDLATVDPLEWHGLMLTLSHLLYRRSPPADQLSDIIHALLLGLSFEKRSVSGASVGSNVRDAACFGIWALARRYTTKELLGVPTHSVFAAKAHPPSSSILQVLGTELVTTASLDPAGNIRRGASAALQELIGRHPDTVEKGIWVVQTVDYHAVARRSRAIEEVALGSAALSTQYGGAIIDSILGWRGVGDVDAAPRRDAAAAFGRLTTELATTGLGGAFDQFESSIDLVTGKLDILEKRQVEERHGLLLCFAAVMEQLPLLLQRSKAGGGHGDAEVSRIVGRILLTVTAILKDCRASTYRRPELIAEAASKLVVSLFPALHSEIVGNASPDHLLTMTQLLSLSADGASGYLPIVSAVDHKEKRPEIDELLAALRDVVPQWLARNEPEVTEPTSAAALLLLLFSAPVERTSTLTAWASSVEQRPTSRKTTLGDGYFYTLSVAQPLAAETCGPVKEGGDIVCKAILNRWRVDSDVDTRVAILQALTRSRVLRDRPLVFLDVLFDGLNDYTTTARGDVGSHVRAHALRAVKELWENVHDGQGVAEWVGASARALFYSVLRLSAEKLDRIRPEAQAVVSLMLRGEYAERFRSTSFSSKSYFRSLLGLIHRETPHHPAVSTLVETDASRWMAEMLAGFVTSADTGNEDLVIASRASLTDFCNESPLNLKLVCDALLDNLKTRQGEDRVVVPTLEVVAFLLRVGLLQRGEGVNLRSMCLQTQRAGYKTGNVRKIEACIKVYGGIAAAETAATPGVQEARRRLGALLFHPWPKVRVAVVDELWVLAGDDPDQGGCSRLTGVDWGAADKSHIRAVVQHLRLE